MNHRYATAVLLSFASALAGCAAGAGASAGLSIDTAGHTALTIRGTASVATGGRQGSSRAPSDERLFGGLQASLAVGVLLDQPGYRLGLDMGFGMTFLAADPGWMGRGALLGHLDVLWLGRTEAIVRGGVGLSLSGLSTVTNVPGATESSGSVSAFGGIFEFVLLFTEDEGTVEGLFYGAPVYRYLAFDEPLG